MEAVSLAEAQVIWTMATSITPGRARRAPLVAALVVLALVAGGIVLATRNGDGDDTAEGASGTDGSETSSDPGETDEPSATDSRDPEVSDRPESTSTLLGTEGGAEATDAPTILDVAAIYDIPGRGDQGFNDLTAAGVAAVASEYGASVTELTTDGTDRGFLLDHVAASARTVVAVGFLFEADAATAAAAHPDTYYIVVDATATDFSQEPPVPMAPNLAGLLFDDEEGAFPVGAAAAVEKPDALGPGGVAGDNRHPAGAEGDRPRHLPRGDCHSLGQRRHHRRPGEADDNRRKIGRAAGRERV